jgi:hypothetical protein
MVLLTTLFWMAINVSNAETANALQTEFSIFDASKKATPKQTLYVLEDLLRQPLLLVNDGRDQVVVSTQVDTFEKAGRLLREEIMSVFESLIRSNRLRGSNDISSLVAGYIPVGISFDSAEQVLKSAGFTVYPRPPANTTENRPDRYNVAAFLQLDHGGSAKIEAIVSLSPKGPGDYGEVAAVSAGIFSSSP